MVPSTPNSAQRLRITSPSRTSSFSSKRFSWPPICSRLTGGRPAAAGSAGPVNSSPWGTFAGAAGLGPAPRERGARRARLLRRPAPGQLGGADPPQREGALPGALHDPQRQVEARRLAVALAALLGAALEVLLEHPLAVALLLPALRAAGAGQRHALGQRPQPRLPAPQQVAEGRLHHQRGAGDQHGDEHQQRAGGRQPPGERLDQQLAEGAAGVEHPTAPLDPPQPEVEQPGGGGEDEKGAQPAAHHPRRPLPPQAAPGRHQQQGRDQERGQADQGEAHRRHLGADRPDPVGHPGAAAARCGVEQAGVGRPEAAQAEAEQDADGEQQQAEQLVALLRRQPGALALLAFGGVGDGHGVTGLERADVFLKRCSSSPRLTMHEVYHSPRRNASRSGRGPQARHPIRRRTGGAAAGLPPPGDTS